MIHMFQQQNIQDIAVDHKLSTAKFKQVLLQTFNNGFLADVTSFFDDNTIGVDCLDIGQLDQDGGSFLSNQGVEKLEFLHREIGWDLSHLLNTEEGRKWIVTVTKIDVTKLNANDVGNFDAKLVEMFKLLLKVPGIVEPVGKSQSGNVSLLTGLIRQFNDGCIHVLRLIIKVCHDF